jgi:hypothetical protein
MGGEQPMIAALLQEFREGVPMELRDAAALERESSLQDFHLERQQLVRFSAHEISISRYMPFVKIGDPLVD